MQAAYLVIIHVYSQIIRKYLPLPPWDGALSTVPQLERSQWLHLVPEAAALYRWVDEKMAGRIKAAAAAISAAITQTQQAMSHHGAVWITAVDPMYPLHLRAIPDPPLALTVAGDVSLLLEPGIAVVGARKAKTASLRSVYQLGQKLAEGSRAVVSGGAYGIDIAVHRGMLSVDVNPCRAVVVVAGGLGNLGPRGNVTTFMRILRHGGAVLSERLWHAEARPMDFPIRNRIVSGLSNAVIVAESSRRSGALITANLALDQGREVFVLTPEDGEHSSGNAYLCGEGAREVAGAEDMLASLAL